METWWAVLLSLPAGPPASPLGTGGSSVAMTIVLFLWGVAFPLHYNSSISWHRDSWRRVPQGRHEDALVCLFSQMSCLLSQLALVLGAWIFLPK